MVRESVDRLPIGRSGRRPTRHSAAVGPGARPCPAARSGQKRREAREPDKAYFRARTRATTRRGRPGRAAGRAAALRSPPGGTPRAVASRASVSRRMLTSPRSTRWRNRESKPAASASASCVRAFLWRRRRTLPATESRRTCSRGSGTPQRVPPGSSPEHGTI